MVLLFALSLLPCQVADELVKELSEYDRKDRGSNEVVSAVQASVW